MARSLGDERIQDGQADFRAGSRSFPTALHFALARCLRGSAPKETLIDWPSWPKTRRKRKSRSPACLLVNRFGDQR